MSFTKVSVAGIGTTGTITFTNVNVAGVITATSFSGSGANLTGVASTDNIRTNTNATFLQSVNVTGIVTAAGVNASGVITATSFSGSGANLTGLAATANVTTSSLVVIGVTTVTAGSVSAPSITPTGDTNTGIFFPSADTIAFGEGGSEAARIDSSGRFGIGTTSPNTLLHLETSGTGNSEFTIKNNNASPGSGRILFADQGASDAGVIQYEHDVNAMVFKTNASEGARIDSSGNLKFNSGYGSVATAYGCRAWVNFNGTSTVAIRASGNVSSITDNGGTGDYTVNLTTAMPDANFCWTATTENQGPGDRLFAALNAPNTTSTLRVSTYNEGGTQKDSAYVFVTVFR